MLFASGIQSVRSPTPPAGRPAVREENEKAGKMDGSRYLHSSHSSFVVSLSVSVAARPQLRKKPDRDKQWSVGPPGFFRLFNAIHGRGRLEAGWRAGGRKMTHPLYGLSLGRRRRGQKGEARGGWAETAVSRNLQGNGADKWTLEWCVSRARR